MADREPFAILRRGVLTWAIGAVHGNVAKLRALHAQLEPRLRPGDNLIYLGNLLGWGEDVAGAIAEALTFRRAFLAKQGAEAKNVVFLRGSQEEMWQKLLTIQFAPNPTEVLNWMVANGIEATLSAYGARSDDGLAAAREGIMSVIQWTNGLRDRMRKQDGHNALFSALKRAAYVEDSVLFVHAGIDPTRPLSEQLDSFWWGGHNFDAIETPYSNFTRVVRGFDHKHRGVRVKPVTVSLDGGCGFGGALVAGCFEPSGDLIDRIDV